MDPGVEIAGMPSCPTCGCDKKRPGGVHVSSASVSGGASCYSCGATLWYQFRVVGLCIWCTYEAAARAHRVDQINTWFDEHFRPAEDCFARAPAMTISSGEGADEAAVPFYPPQLPEIPGVYVYFCLTPSNVRPKVWRPVNPALSQTIPAPRRTDA